MAVRHLIVSALMFAQIGSVSAEHCRCSSAKKDDTNRWGGNEMIVVVTKNSRRQIEGSVKTFSRPMEGALVEVFNNPDYLLKESTLNHPPNQRRIAACVTGTTGGFFFRHLPSGNYELRVSRDAGMNVTHVYIVVDRKKGVPDRIDVELRVGT